MKKKLSVNPDLYDQNLKKIREDSEELYVNEKKQECLNQYDEAFKILTNISSSGLTEKYLNWFCFFYISAVRVKTDLFNEKFSNSIESKTKSSVLSQLLKDSEAAKKWVEKLKEEKSFKDWNTYYLETAGYLLVKASKFSWNWTVSLYSLLNEDEEQNHKIWHGIFSNFENAKKFNSEAIKCFPDHQDKDYEDYLEEFLRDFIQPYGIIENKKDPTFITKSQITNKKELKTLNKAPTRRIPKKSSTTVKKGNINFRLKETKDHFNYDIKEATKNIKKVIRSSCTDPLDLESLANVFRMEYKKEEMFPEMYSQFLQELIYFICHPPYLPYKRLKNLLKQVISAPLFMAKLKDCSVIWYDPKHCYTVLDALSRGTEKGKKSLADEIELVLDVLNDRPLILKRLLLNINDSGFSCLTNICIQGDEKILGRLFDRIDIIKNTSLDVEFAKGMLNKMDNYQRSLLSIACMKGFLNIVELLVNYAELLYKSNLEGYLEFINHKDKWSFTPLHLAIKADSLPIASFILNKIKKIYHENPKLIKLILLTTDEDQFTIFHSCKCIAMAKLLYDFIINEVADFSGSNFINKENYRGKTPLHMACENYLKTRLNHDFQMISFLIAKGANKSILSGYLDKIADNPFQKKQPMLLHETKQIAEKQVKKVNGKRKFENSDLFDSKKSCTVTKKTYSQREYSSSQQKDISRLSFGK